MRGVADSVPVRDHERSTAYSRSYRVAGDGGAYAVKVLADRRLAARQAGVFCALRDTRALCGGAWTLPMPEPESLRMCDDGRGECVLVTQWVEGVSLAAYLSAGIARHGYAWRAASALAAVASALGRMNAAPTPVAHGDLKPDNILVRRSAPGGVEAVLLDFDTLAFAGEPAAGVPLGALAYMPPERLDPAAAVHARSDLYSFGVLAHVLLAGFAPGGPSALAQRIPQPARGLVRACLDPDPAGRPHPSEAASAFAAVAAALEPPAACARKAKAT